MSDVLRVRSPQDRVIAEYVCDDASIADCATQLQQTGEETQELHRFVMSIIDGQITVQDGISIAALQDMAMSVGDTLGPLGDYFVELASATWSYAEVCRVAGDATKHMVERQSNLSNSLAALVEERELTDGVMHATRSLPEDGTAAGYMMPYSVLLEDGSLNVPTQVIQLDGVQKASALLRIEAHQGAVQTLHEAVHARQDEQLIAWDLAIEAWEEGAATFVQALDGILGVLADTAAEDDYQRLGTVGEVAGVVGVVADVLMLIPIPPWQAAMLVVGLLATSVESSANGGQALKAQYQSGDGSIRVVEGQIVGEGKDAGVVAVSGFVPVGDLVRKLMPLTKSEKKVAEGVETGSDVAGETADGVGPEQGSRKAAPAVDVGVSPAPIDEWQEEADATNPDVDAPGRPMPASDERAEHIEGYTPPVQIPEAEGEAAPDPGEPADFEVTSPEGAAARRPSNHG